MSVLNTFLNINGVRYDISADGDRSLLDIVRNELSLTGSHFGCGQGLCGACMVLLEGHPVNSCDTPLWSAAGKSLITIEGVGQSAIGARLQQEFINQAAAQCGYCTSGMLISALALLVQNPNPSEQEIRHEMDKNLCRCGSHLRVIQAIRNVSDALPEVA